MKTKTETITAGPWEYRAGTSPHYQGQIYEEGTGKTVAISYNDENGANAALIAAAPEMLDELKKCRIAITFFRNWMEDAIPGSKTKYPFGEDCEKSARAIIAKAEGGVI